MRQNVTLFAIVRRSLNFFCAINWLLRGRSLLLTEKKNFRSFQSLPEILSAYAQHFLCLSSLPNWRSYCCWSSFGMSKPSNIDDDDENKLGSDYFSFYVGEVCELFSEDYVVPYGSQTSELCSGDDKGKSAIEENHYPLFSNSLKADSKRERLKGLLRQGVGVLSQGVDEMFDPVISIHRLRSILRTRNCPTLEGPISDDNGGKSSQKKLKFSSTTSPADGSAGICGSNVEMNEDLQLLLEHDRSEVEEIISKYSDDLSETLKHMEQQLEKLLDSVMSKCRPMSPREKQQLQKMIQKLPPDNLAHVVEIILHHRPDKELSPVEIFVDLDKEADATLWRLYYYTEAFEKAKKLAKVA